MVSALFFLHGLSCLGQRYNDIMITEIMCDPTPVVGLPDVEYIEIYNRSPLPVSLKNWTFAIGSRSLLLPDSTVQPGAFAILCSQSGYSRMKKFGHTIPLSALILPNEGSNVALFNSKKTLIFSISYSLKWWTYDKRSGGYAIEMTDVSNPCGEADNWKTSADESGGTPGRMNSIRRENSDKTAPEKEYVDLLSAKDISVTFTEKLDSLTAVAGTRINVEGRGIITKKLESPGFKNLILTLDAPLLPGEVYQVSLQNIADCAGNILRQTEFLIALPVSADSGDIVLNEILFNPNENGVDFVEIYNASKKYINLKNWSIANTRNGKSDVLRKITTRNYILSPFTYLAFTSDKDQTKESFPTERPSNLLEVDEMPGFSNQSGGVVLLDDSNHIYDHFEYDESMHNPLISNPKGVSLEKVDVHQSSQLSSNWHSAASTAGNATPGYANSEIKPDAADDLFFVEPEAFIPRSNGLDGFAKITYHLRDTGETASVRIFDTAGRLIKNLLRNQLIGTSGEIRWDGTNENGIDVDTGYYLILVDTMNPNGKSRKFKLKVVVLKN